MHCIGLLSNRAMLQFMQSTSTSAIRTAKGFFQRLIDNTREVIRKLPMYKDGNIALDVSTCSSLIFLFWKLVSLLQPLQRKAKSNNLRSSARTVKEMASGTSSSKLYLNLAQTRKTALNPCTKVSCALWTIPIPTLVSLLAATVHPPSSFDHRLLVSHSSVNKALTTTGVKGAFVEGCTYRVASRLIYLAETLLFYVGAVLIAQGLYTYLQMVEVLNLVVFSVTIGSQLMAFGKFFFYRCFFNDLTWAFSVAEKIAKSVQAAHDLHHFLTLSLSTDEFKGSSYPPLSGSISTDIQFNYPWGGKWELEGSLQSKGALRWRGSWDLSSILMADSKMDRSMFDGFTVKLVSLLMTKKSKVAMRRISYFMHPSYR